MHMYYKSIALITLLLPVFGYSQDSEKRVVEREELSKLQFQLELELDDIGKRITASYEFLYYLGTHWTRLEDWAVNKKLQAMEKADPDTRHTKQEDIDSIKKRIAKEIEAENISVGNDLFNALWGEDTFDHDLSQELFAYEDLDTLDIFDTLKFSFLRMATGRHLLKHLVISYEICLKKILKISQELAALEQQGHQ